MEKYIKPTFEYAELRVEETFLSSDCSKNNDTENSISLTCSLYPPGQAKKF